MDIRLIADAPVLLAAGFVQTVASYVVPIFMGLAGLGFVIFVHELGHFVVAKLCGVKCEKFYIGFDIPIRIGKFRLPSRFCRVQWGETEYGIGILPLGGYVKMLGQDDDPRNYQRESERARGEHDADGKDGDSPLDKSGSPKSVVAPAVEFDPRSFPAKSVPARMAIISAGVIMNLITAVLMAAVAFRSGVPYSPTIVGGTTPGDAAWKSGLAPADHIVQIGAESRRNKQMRFDWDLRQAVAQAGLSNPIESVHLVVERPGSDEPQTFDLTPSTRSSKKGALPTLGVVPLASTTIGKVDEDNILLSPTVSKELAVGDKIVAVNGQPLDRSHANWEGDLPNTELSNRLYELRDQPVKLTLERPADVKRPAGAVASTFDVTFPSRPVRSLGLAMQMGPIVAIQTDSPANAAGFKVGDVIQSVNGQPVGDPLRLADWLPTGSRASTQDSEPNDATTDPTETKTTATDAPSSQAPVLVVVERKVSDGESAKTELVELAVAPRADYARSLVAPSIKPLLGLDMIGVAFQIELVVGEVTPGGPAARAGLQPGDRLTHVQFKPADEKKLELSKTKISPYLYADGTTKGEPKTFSFEEEEWNWINVHMHAQEMLSDTQVVLTVERGEAKSPTTEVLDITAEESADWFNPVRGIPLQPFDDLRKEPSLLAAFPAGVQQTKEDLQRVVDLLKKLFTGRTSPKHLGGPLSILAVAGLEANRGFTQLIMFLVFLSANLAILNFLPIPALDGGHFVFLLWEGITGRRPNENVQGALTMAGVVLLLGLIVFVSFNDVGRWMFSSG